MAELRINEFILEAIRQNTTEDENVEKFLLELISMELEHPDGWWHFKEPYRKKISEYSLPKEPEDENQQG
jgi:hypothetical protein